MTTDPTPTPADVPAPKDQLRAVAAAEIDTLSQIALWGLHESKVSALDRYVVTAREALNAAADPYELGLAAGRTELRDLINDLADPDPCWFDHHGHCQAHGWTETEPRCPHARAKELPEMGADRD